MIPALSLFVGLAGFLFGVYQWRRQRGRVCIRLDQAQDRLFIRVVVDAPTPAHVSGLAYQIRARGWLVRLLRTWMRERMHVRKRLAAIWRFRGMDLEMAWLETVAPGDPENPREEIQPPDPVFNPVAGSDFPAPISGYDDDTWVMYGSNYARHFEELVSRWKKPRIRIRAPLSGHPKRVVHSRWVRLDALEMLDERNEWLVRDQDRGLPQIPRMTLGVFSQEVVEDASSEI